MKKTIYIHYGSNAFDRGTFRNVFNVPARNKPDGGLWASRIDSPYGWLQWCNENDFRKESFTEAFRFSLSNTAKVLEIHSVADTKLIESQEKPGWYILNDIIPDFEKMKKNYDAIELFLSDDWNLYYALYGWDCDCILIMNPEIIIPLTVL